MTLPDTNAIIREHLANNTALAALVGDRIYSPRLPENADLPAVGFFTRGGTSKGDTVKQKELSEVVYEIVDAGLMVHYEAGNVEIMVNDAADAADRDLVAKACLIALTQFEGDKGTVKGVVSYKMLRGKRLSVTLSRTKEVWKTFQEENRD